MLKVRSYILCDLDPKVKVIGQKAGICDGVPSTSALVGIVFSLYPSSGHTHYEQISSLNILWLGMSLLINLAQFINTTCISC